MPVSQTRVRVLFVLFLVASSLLAVRLTQWQAIDRGRLASLATAQVRSDELIPAQRGIIRDRNGAILATTVELRSLYAIPSRVKDKAATAAALGVLLGRDPKPILDRLSSGAEWTFIHRRLPEAAAKAIAALGIEGLGFETEPKRVYPNDQVAAHLLGFVNDDGVGVYGVEGAYDDVLRGTPGRLVVERDPSARALPVGLRHAVPARDGAELTLTIDLVIQHAAERELAAAIAKEKAAAGTIVVLDPKDGAILALASYPTFDPSAVAVSDPEALRDRAIAWAFEPGSTLKSITVAAALDAGLVTPATTYNDVGYAVIGGRRLNNALGKVWGPTTVTQVLERSANAGAVFVASKLGAERLHAALATFGLGRKTGVDLAGEIGGRVRPLAEWYPVDVGTAAFGQGLTTTPLQLASAYAALANGGILYRPHAVASRRDADGEHRTEPVAIRRAVAPETAAAMRAMLTSTVDNGLAQNARLAAFSVAGKTGTAQIPDAAGSYESDQYISSFAGFAPADDPRFVAVVVLERPESRILGTLTATSAFKGLALDVLRTARVQPDRAGARP
ncbi:MAG TPA: penicillin-binding protein 2 [Candidatus Limnocylindria bacterium]|nr:penicillin-binding protein 2 [Candidatus Limnocylindria bacterium]